MNFPWLGLISTSIILSALSRCKQCCTATHPWTWGRSYAQPCPFQTNVSVSLRMGGHLAAAHPRGAPISHSPFLGPYCAVISVKLLGLSCVLHGLPHFLPSFLEHTGNTFSPTPIPACSLSQPLTLPLSPFLSIFPLRLCYCLVECWKLE